MEKEALVTCPVSVGFACETLRSLQDFEQKGRLHKTNDSACIKERIYDITKFFCMSGAEV